MTRGLGCPSGLPKFLAEQLPTWTVVYQSIGLFTEATPLAEAPGALSICIVQIRPLRKPNLRKGLGLV